MTISAPWSKEEDQRLRDLAHSGLGSEDIATRMKRSRSAIRANAERLDITIACGRNEKVTVRRLVELGLKAKGK
ncbi:hypothetical protein [Bradyrhizobium sp. JYMT SZCCT0428]|uniref:hypothetical protein n=1 Tax=Bradyrhizobium sp. JYMT SZCCT0428 TaxID=2807673 RepID=UPI001BA9CB16|nr:hypothetical protein [Bradyrhizobium sp. JYMT SZCCT0428]MBR1149060.1 hypothetical protein [Bradyrhizobium sp. JYMT SZCCT0428]